MEKQRSFSFKPTRLLVLYFTITSPAIFFTFFTIWTIKATPSVRQETQFQFNESSLSLGPSSVTVQTLSTFSGNFSTTSEKDSFLIDTHYRRLENGSGVASNSVSGGQQRKEDGVGVAVDEGGKGDGLEGELLTMKESIPESSHEKIELPSSKRSADKRNRTTSSEDIKVSNGEKIEQKRVKDCDLRNGRWVYDEGYPLYRIDSCPFIDQSFNCKRNGRMDMDYMKWRWQPQDCEIPRFNATKMLELIRGKRLVFVGDSLNRNQWESMLCMLLGGIRDPNGQRTTKGKGKHSVKFMDYKCTVEFHVSHFLVRESKARVGQKQVPTLRIDSTDRGTSSWRGADILVFNTAAWWSQDKTTAGINYFQEGKHVHPQLEILTAFRRALMTWASWVDRDINLRKTQVFFRSSSPSHYGGGQWNSGGHCMEATQPLNETSGISSEMNIIVEQVIKKMKTPITLLNITNLSGYRIDGHPSIYRGKLEQSSSSNIQDCNHWCLPGVPDAWNEILYFLLQSRL